MAQFIDFNVLKELELLSPDDPEFVTRIIQLFLETTPPELEKLQQCCASGAAKEMGRVAHGLVSGMQNVGAESLVNICTKLDQLGRDGSLVNADKLVEQVLIDYEKTKKILEQIMETKK